ncbi:Cupredoxin [Usnea florida]
MLLPLLLPLLPLTFATTIPITVGDGALAFNPSTLTASIGDTLSFSYYPKNHSVTQSSFANPCHPLSGGFFSGFHPLSAGPGPVTFNVRVNDTAPLWIYCSQETHCQKGMAMVVNPP